MSTTRQPQMPTAGPVGRQFIANLRGLLEVRGLSQRRASAALEELGRPIPPLGISRTLEGERRTDIDELVAWAALLGVDPVTLLLPRHIDPDDAVELTPKMQQRARIVWGWMRGRWPLPAEFWPEGVAVSFPTAAFHEFAERTRPDFSQPLEDPAVAALVELQELIEVVLGSPDPAAKWGRVRGTILRQFRLAAIQLEGLFARLDGGTPDADTAQQINAATDRVLWAGVDSGPHGAPTSETTPVRGVDRPAGPHGAATSRVDPLDPFGKR